MSEPAVPRPYNLVAELTYRCPLRCAYCSNPLNFRDVPDLLDAGAWARVFREAAELGCVHVGLTGGEPTVRRDLSEIVAAAAEAGLYSLLVTAGTPLDRAGLERLRDVGLRSVQLSLQDVDAAQAEEIAGVPILEAKLAFATWVRELDLPLILNVVLHRHNLSRVPEFITLARKLAASRLELANTQYHGWALRNLAALLPTRAQLEEAAQFVAEARKASPGPELLFVLPDYWADRPKPCMGGWARKTIVVTPAGVVLPCHAAAELPGLAFWRADERGLRACWADAPGMRAFRGEAWMPEPCRSCPERGRDFGGCRCQAFALVGDPAATDPACSKAPRHDLVLAARAAVEGGAATRVLLRGAAA
jgi:pyrroloquinoline quinone biosynthesis protein E